MGNSRESWGRGCKTNRLNFRNDRFSHQVISQLDTVSENLVKRDERENRVKVERKSLFEVRRELPNRMNSRRGEREEEARQENAKRNMPAAIIRD